MVLAKGVPTMTDFVTFEPDDHGQRLAQLSIRLAQPHDALPLAHVMVARGGTAHCHYQTATQLIANNPIVLIATHSAQTVGWSGAQQTTIRPGEQPNWLVSGLTVIPAWRRHGIGLQLLRAVPAAVSTRDPQAVVHSVINAGNLASIQLHQNTGFTEIGTGPTFAGIHFHGGSGILLAHRPECSQPL